MQVSSNGLLSFNRSTNFFNPVLFPNSTSYSYIVAPFWADHDPRPAGQISYAVYSTNSEVLSTVNRFIRQQTGTNFEGSWMLVAYWDNIPEYQSDADKVSAKLEWSPKLQLCPQVPKGVLICPQKGTLR